MTKEGFCKVCSFFSHVKWEKAKFEKKVREGSSLRILEAYLEGLGLEVSKDTISKHLKLCMNAEVKEQRKIEKALLKAKEPFQKLSRFFIKPELPQPCEHLRTTQFYDIAIEKVFVRCSDCGAILGRGIDPEENERRMEKDPRNLKIYESLRRKRT